MNIDEAIEDLKKSTDEVQVARKCLYGYIEKFPLGKNTKSKLFGWGESNYTKRMRQNIPNETLIKCVEKLIDYKGL